MRLGDHERIRISTAARSGPRTTLLHHAVSRRAFLRGSATAAGALAGSGLLGSRALAGTCEPRPIEGGFEVPDVGFFHVILPAPGADPSTITDFRGKVGLAVVRGRWAARDLATGDRVPTERPAFWEADIRFMKGAFESLDGQRCRGAFGFV